MIDIKQLRADTQQTKDKMARRKENIDIDGILAMDLQRRQIISEVEAKKAQQNQISKEIPKLKKQGEDVSELLKDMKSLSDQIKSMDEGLHELDSKMQAALLAIPNIPDDNVPDGDTDDDNVEVRRFGEPRQFDFEPKPHWDLGEALGMLDFARAAKITGSRFAIYTGALARLERSIVNYFLDTHTQKNGYTEVFPPFMVNRDSMTGTGQLPKFEEDAFKVGDSDYFMVPTAEVPVTNMYRNEILTKEQLPICLAAYSACFRAEAGSAGRDTRGLIRQHQFNKVELVKFCEPESSFDELEKLTANAESVLVGLGLPYRVVKICVGDLGFAAAFKYDIEVYMPSYGRYVEISSCSNFLDFQARRAQIRYRKAKDDKPMLVHTLNGSGVAVGRTVAAIMENYQNEDGSITVPQALKGYMGMDKINA